MSPLCVLVLCEILFSAGRVEAHKDLNLSQEDGVKTVKVGEWVNLHCSCTDESVTFFSWYQQILGGRPQVILSRMKQNSKANVMQAYRGRFDVRGSFEKGTNDLMITNLQLSDSAMYYCGVLVFSAIEFGRGVFLHVKPSQSTSHATVHQPAVAPFGLGDTGSLSCTVQSEPCEGGQELYWFRHGAPGPSVVYPSEGRCRTEQPHGTTCTSNISVTALRPSDSAVYYCAAVTCGEIVFGHGTHVQIIGSKLVNLVLVCSLGAVFAVFIIVLAVLAVVACKLRRRPRCVSEGAVSHQASRAASDAPSQEEDTLHYVALSLRKNDERPHQEESVCVYARVKNRKE